MSDFGTAMHKAQDAIRDAVPGVVRRHRAAGILTWRLLHQIESEVLAELAASGQHSRQLLGMLRSSELLGFPKDDTEVTLKGNACPVVFGEAYKAWHRVD